MMARIFKDKHNVAGGTIKLSEFACFIFFFFYLSLLFYIFMSILVFTNIALTDSDQSLDCFN